MSTKLIAERYANAFYACVREHGELATAYQDLEEFSSRLAREPSLRKLLDHPGVSRSDKKMAIDSHAQGLGVWTRRFLHYLVDRGRTALIGDINDWFRSRYLDEQSIAPVELTAAISLSETALQEVLQRLEQVLQRQVRAKVVVDPGIMGGLVIRHKGVVYDGSVRTMLHKINRRLGGGVGT